MTWPVNPSTRVEAHFGDRLVRCFRERPRSVDRLLREAVARHPSGEALVAGAERIRYRELDVTVGRIAAHLARAGLGAGERLAILIGNRPEFFYALLAAARLGAIAVPINIREQTPGLEYILNHCGAKMLVHDADLTERLPEASALRALTRRYAVGGDAAGAASFADLMQPTEPNLRVAISEEDVAVILYTSGTTGRPKGAMLTHFNIVHSVMHYEACMGLSQRDRSALAVPASHVTGVVAILLTMLRVSGCTVLLPQFKARDYLMLATRERITHTILVPAMYNLCLLEPDFDVFDLTAWRIGGYGGAPMPEATIARLAGKLPNLILMNAYGATETTSPTSLMPPGHTAGRSDSVGRVVHCGEVRIMDDEGREVAANESGEIWIGGPMVVPGYWNNPEATAASFIGGFWRSGDIGVLDEHGYLRVFDRKKDLINRGGYKIYSAEIENTLAHYPGVVECAAVAHPDPVLGEKLHVFVRCQEPVAADRLKAFCAERLADYKIPDFITFLSQPLPRNANGKILKAELRTLALDAQS